MEISHAKALETSHTLRLFPFVPIARLCLSARQVKSSDVWNNNQSPCELGPISSLSGLDGLGSQNNLNSSWNAASRQLCLG